MRDQMEIGLRKQWFAFELENNKECISEIKKTSLRINSGNLTFRSIYGSLPACFHASRAFIRISPGSTTGLSHLDDLVLEVTTPLPLLSIKIRLVVSNYSGSYETDFICRPEYIYINRF